MKCDDCGGRAWPGSRHCTPCNGQPSSEATSTRARRRSSRCWLAVHARPILGLPDTTEGDPSRWVAGQPPPVGHDPSKHDARSRHGPHGHLHRSAVDLQAGHGRPGWSPRRSARGASRGAFVDTAEDFGAALVADDDAPAREIACCLGIDYKGRLTAIMEFPAVRVDDQLTPQADQRVLRGRTCVSRGHPHPGRRSLRTDRRMRRALPDLDLEPLAGGLASAVPYPGRRRVPARPLINKRHRLLVNGASYRPHKKPGRVVTRDVTTTS
jgi:hypothetical protein